MTSPNLFDTRLYDQSDIPNFYPMDSRELYEKNLATQPQDWIWRTQPVSYTLNSLGYRCAEFDTIDWSNSILCFGCSHTFGVGVSDHDTWPAHLSRLLNVPTVNLGIAGSSIQLNWATTVRLLTAGIRPRAVVYYWPDANRSCEFEPDGKICNWGVWREPVISPDKRRGYLGTAWMLNAQHNRTMAQLYIDSIAWSCPTLHYTWSSQLNIPTATHMIKIDTARDMMHPGPLSQKAFAHVIKLQLGI